MTLKTAFFNCSPLRRMLLWGPAGLLFFLCFGRAAAQDTLYFDKDFEPVGDRANAFYREIRAFNPVDPKRCVVTTSAVKGKVLSVVRYADYAKAERDSLCSFWYAGGKICLETVYQDGERNGPETSYYPDGQMKSEVVWGGNRILSARFFKPDGSPKTEASREDIWVEDLVRPPHFQGDRYVPKAYLRSVLRFPRSELRDGQPELAILSFVVEKNGGISGLKLVTPSVSPILNKEALRVVGNMTKWEPEQVNGVPERYFFLFPVLFE